MEWSVPNKSIFHTNPHSAGPVQSHTASLLTWGVFFTLSLGLLHPCGYGIGIVSQSNPTGARPGRTRHSGRHNAIFWPSSSGGNRRARDIGYKDPKPSSGRHDSETVNPQTGPEESPQNLHPLQQDRRSMHAGLRDHGL